MLQKLITPLALIDKKLITVLMLLTSLYNMYSQITIGTPQLGFSQVCASSGFNNYSLSFTFSPVDNLNSGNLFSIELSDASGSYANPTLLTTSTSNTSPVNVSFSFPTNVNGSGYKIRIKSSSPSATSASSVVFAANYAVFNQTFTINNNVSTQGVCGATNYNLSIDNGTNSPLQYSQLTYKWYKNNVEILGETSSSININQNGNYYVKVNYGSCAMNAYSNIVTVTFLPVTTLTISSQGNSTIVCPSNGLLLSSSSLSGYSYQWYKNGTILNGATSANYTASEAGIYQLKASNSSCTIDSNTITLIEETINVSLDSGAEINILPGETKTITCSTNANNPSYKWYKNNVLLSSETSSFLNINSAGTYKVLVKQNNGCSIEKEVSTLVSAPASYQLQINSTPDYVECESEDEQLNITSFKYTSSLGVFDVPSSLTLNYKWFKNNIEISGANNNSLTIPNFNENGDYTLEISFSNGQIISSNTKTIKLKLTEIITLISDGDLCNNSTVVLSTNSTNTNYAYKWYKEGSSTVLGTNSTYSTSEVGNYFVTISFIGCEINSNILTVNAVDETLLETNFDAGTIEIVNGEEITITASGMDGYQWFINDVLSGTSNQLTVNSELDLLLIGTINGCEITREFNVILVEPTINEVIPNLITPNNDGKNDTWILTDEYSYNPSIEIIIFSSNYEILFKSKNYQNNWPQDSSTLKNKIYYYTILKEETILKKGSISIIK